MQELKREKMASLLSGCGGSVLVGAIALATLMAIMDVGYMQAASNGVNFESRALENEKAFQAAESGIWVAARWLRAQSQAQWLALGSDYQPFNGRMTLDNMDIVTKISVRSVAGVPVASLNAEVYKDLSGGHQMDASTFKKRIRATDVRLQSFGSYCTFYNTFQPDYTNYVSGQFKQFAALSDWGGFGNRTFSGRFHMNNCYIKLNQNSRAGGTSPVIFRNGLVTVATPTDPNVSNNFHNNYGYSSTSGNNYNSGVWAAWTSPTAAQLDSVFTGDYQANFDQIALPASQINATAILNNANISPSDKYDLAVSDDEGEEQNNYRPSLVFNGTSAVYEYKQGGTRRNYTYSAINGKIFCCHTNLNVYGTVQGKVTVTTAPGTSIVPVGNLIVNDYNTATGSLNRMSDTSSIIGLAPGKHVRFNGQWKKYFLSDGSAVQKNVCDQVTGGSGGTMHLCASILATGSATVTYTTNAQGTATTARTETGSEYWDLTSAVMYGLRIYGNHILGGYRPVSSGYHGISNGGCNGTQTFVYDSRMSNFDLQPPAYPKQTTVGNLSVLRIKGWTEENVF